MWQWLSLDMYEVDRDLCTTCLAQHLAAGTVGLMVGAGISHGMKLPLWWELVRDCRSLAGLDYAEITDKVGVQELRRAMDEVQCTVGSRAAYHDLVRTNLYANVATDETLLKQPLLVALGAMMMRSKRGACGEVVTLNFDDILERYLRINGYVAQVVRSLPCLRRDRKSVV